MWFAVTKTWSKYRQWLYETEGMIIAPCSETTQVLQILMLQI